MIPDFIIRTGWFFLLTLLQVMVCNHVHIVGYATPMPIVFFLIMLSSDTPRWVYILLGFTLGLIVDMFDNTPGMHAASLTFTGLLTPLVLRFFLPADYEKGDSLLPTHNTLEWGPFFWFVTLVTLINTATYFALEIFSFFEWSYLLLNIVGSWILTVIFILALELIRTTRT